MIIPKGARVYPAGVMLDRAAYYSKAGWEAALEADKRPGGRGVVVGHDHAEGVTMNHVRWDKPAMLGESWHLDKNLRVVG